MSRLDVSPAFMISLLSVGERLLKSLGWRDFKSYTYNIHKQRLAMLEIKGEKAADSYPGFGNRGSKLRIYEI